MKPLSFQANAMPASAARSTHETASLTPQSEVESLAEELTVLCGHINAGLARFLRLLGDFEALEGWHPLGLASLPQWLGYRCGVGAVAAREYVRVAKALRELPHIRAAFEAGQVSYSKVRAMTRVATPANEASLLMIAHYATAAQVERLTRCYRRVVAAQTDCEGASVTYAKRELTLSPSWDDPTVVELRGRIPAEMGAVLEQALSALMESAYRAERNALDSQTDSADGASTYPVDPLPSTHPQRRADALVQMAEHVLGQLAARDVSAETSPEGHVDAEGTLQGLGPGQRVEVRVTVDHGVLARVAEGGTCSIDAGHSHRHPYALAVETARRLSCDASRVTIVTGAQGEPLNLGRKTRTLSPALKRALHARDGHCRFPGCDRVAHLEGHHVRHWADGGPTALDNLVHLCRFHHRLVHEEQFSVHPVSAPSAGCARFEFRTPCGALLDERPHQRVTDWLGLRLHNLTYGFDLEATTGVSGPRGEPMDYALAVEGLLQRDGLLDYRPSAVVRAGT